MKRSIRTPYEKITDQLYQKYGNKITLLTTKENYLGTHYTSEFKCNDCGITFKQRINTILSKRYNGGCNNCKELNKKYLKIDDIKNILILKHIQIITNDTLLVKSRKYEFLCLKCNKKYKNTLGNMLELKNCGKCHNYGIQQIKNMLVKDINIIENTYISISKKSTFHCKICDTYWNTRVTSIVNERSGCPCCKKSKGERIVEKYLINNNIQFNPQFMFDNCRNKKKLPFDFYLPDYNACIEFDGYLHYYPWNNKEKSLKKFEDTKRNDNIKNNFCKINNIKLIRIPYTEIKNISDILSKNFYFQ